MVGSLLPGVPKYTTSRTNIGNQIISSISGYGEIFAHALNLCNMYLVTFNEDDRQRQNISVIYWRLGLRKTKLSPSKLYLAT